MQAPARTGDLDAAATELTGDFSQRLETSLRAADRYRRRRQLFERLRLVLPIVLLVGPLVAWRLMLASPNGVHVVIDTVAWLAFYLDVGVHIDSALLEYGSLQAVPSVVGVALGVLLAARLLWYRRDDA